MEALLDRLTAVLKDPKTVCVFPTETTARSWLERIVSDERSPYRVMREDRFISWDRCRTRLFPRKDERIPSNSIYRLVFAQNVLLENTGSPFLRYMVPADYSDDSSHFARDITSLCPHLQTLKECMGSLDIHFQHDIDALLQRYHTFLESNGLFEPLFDAEVLDVSYLEASGRRFILVFPEIMTDMYRVSEQLEASPFIGRISVHGQVSDILLGSYGNSKIEVVHTVSRIEGLMTSGVRAEDIAVTLCDYPGLSGELASQARLRGLPIHFRGGRPLSEFPVSRLFRDLEFVSTDAFSHHSLKRLLLGMSYPWKERQLHEDLIAMGIRGSCIRNYRKADGRPVDIWEEKLYGKTRLLEYYTRLKNWIDSLTAATSPDQLLERIRGFQAEFLYELPPTDERASILSFCIDSLRAFKDIGDTISFPKGFPVFSAWLTLLDGTQYVPQEPASGISVYPYGAAAGISPEYHFILGADQNHVAKSVDPFSMLPERERESLDSIQIDLTADILSVYQVSGMERSISFSRKSRGGDQLAPHFFLENSSIIPYHGDAYEGDPFGQELSFWAGEDSLQGLYPVQVSGFECADKTVFAKDHTDLSQVAGSVGEEFGPIREAFADAQGRIRISPTSLDRFVKCPYNWFLSYLLGIDEVDYEMEFTDARSLGILIHNCYERLFGWLSEEHEGKLLPEEQDTAVMRLHEIIDEELSSYMRSFESVTPAVRPRISAFLHEKLPSLVTGEIEHLSGFAVDSLEASVSYAPEGSDILLEGRVDRVSRALSGREIAIIDYKKRNHVRVKSFSSDEAYPDSYQLPLYTYLTEKSDPGSTEVSKALYYDVTDEKFIWIFPGKGRGYSIDRERFDEVITQMLEEIDRMSTRIKTADFRIGGVSPEHCEGCRFRSICRGRYAIR